MIKTILINITGISAIFASFLIPAGLFLYILHLINPHPLLWLFSPLIFAIPFSIVICTIEEKILNNKVRELK